MRGSSLRKATGDRPWEDASLSKALARPVSPLAELDSWTQESDAPPPELTAPREGSWGPLTARGAAHRGHQNTGCPAKQLHSLSLMSRALTSVGWGDQQ